MPGFIGQYFSHYHILEQLGEGGMAVVYKAYDTRLERHVAIKVILPGKEHSEKFLKRFEREAKALAQLGHPNIVKVIDYGEHESLPYLVMEYLPGGTLKRKMRGRPTPWQDAARMLLPIARALAYAHEHKVIHRDVKPSNILITDSGEPMLSDFGVAKMVEAEETMDLTGTGVGVGTPEYMSPEQAQGKVVDVRSDIYSLGVVFYEMVTGRKPYQADTPYAVAIKQATEPLPRPRQVKPDLPERVEQVLLKAMAKKPEDRFKDMSSFANVLEMLAQGARVTVRKAKKDPGSSFRNSPILMTALSGLAVVILATSLIVLGNLPVLRSHMINVSLGAESLTIVPSNYEGIVSGPSIVTTPSPESARPTATVNGPGKTATAEARGTLAAYDSTATALKAEARIRGLTVTAQFGLTVTSIADYNVLANETMRSPDCRALKLKATFVKGINYQYAYLVFRQTQIILPPNTHSYLEYDIYLPTTNPVDSGGIDLTGGTIMTLRDYLNQRIVDSMGYCAHPSCGIPSQFLGQWYHRKFDLYPAAGKSFTNATLAVDTENAINGGNYVAYFKDILIADDRGKVLIELFRNFNVVPYSNSPVSSGLDPNGGTKGISDAQIEVVPCSSVKK